MKFRHFVLAALAMVLGAILSAPSALAFQAAAKTAVNVRSGPGTGFMIVDSLHAGEIVEVGKCKPNGWCHVRHSGPNGWVYSIYLTTAPGSSGVSDPNCGLTLTIGAGGPYLTLNCGGGVPVTPVPVPPVVTAKACFYVNRNYSGAHFCMGPGTRNWLNATFNNRISSVRTWGGAKAKLCRNNNLAGYCRVIQGNRPALGPAINNRTSSLRVFTGPVPVPPPPSPVTHSTGTINLQQTYLANLDNGNRSSGPAADV
ncbi:MAG: SH3 domain-containing protein, partial [Paracoccaceae bacterium]